MKMPKIAFFTVVDLEIGVGHLFRCDALAQALQNYEVNTMLYIDTQETDTWLEEKKISTEYRLVKWKNSPSIVYEIGSIFNTVVVDAYQVSSEIWETLKEAEAEIVVFDDFGEKPFLPGILINGSPGAHLIHYQAGHERTLLLGPSFQVLRPPFWIKSKKHIRENVKSIMMVMGGTDTFGLVQTIAQIVDQTIPKNIAVFCIGEVEEVSSRVISTGFLSSVEMRDTLLHVDLLISAAGQTVAEAVAVGVPTIIVQTAKNQRFNYIGWKEKNICLDGGNMNDSEFPNSILEVVEQVFNQKERKTMRDNSLLLSLHSSTKRVAKQIIKGMGNGKN